MKAKTSCNSLLQNCFQRGADVRHCCVVLIHRWISINISICMTEASSTYTTRLVFFPFMIKVDVRKAQSLAAGLRPRVFRHALVSERALRNCADCWLNIIHSSGCSVFFLLTKRPLTHYALFFGGRMCVCLCLVCWLVLAIFHAAYRGRSGRR